MLVDIAFQALAYASVLYLISVGLSVTLGLMGFVNLAHGIFAMIGGYVAATAIAAFGASWWAMVLVAPLLTGLIAVVIERLLYSRLYGRSELDQVLFCIGLIFLASGLTRLGFGPLLKVIPVPPALAVHLDVGGFHLLAYKILVVGIGMATALGILFGLEKTRIGAVVRAAVENRGMAESVGLRTGLVFTLTFALGGALAALGGIIGSDVFGLNPAYPFDVLVYVQIVVAIAGLGTLRGSFLAALAIGTVQTLSAYFVPEFGTIILFSSVFLLLLVRPQGLFGRI